MKKRIMMILLCAAVSGSMGISAYAAENADVQAKTETEEEAAGEEENAQTEVWYIWGDSMATEAGAEEYDFEGAFDDADFRPSLTPYLLDNQDEAKGNILVCSGGGDKTRGDSYEGIPCCEFFNSIGYNAFLVNYRVYPYKSGTMTLDVQRAVRYLKYYGEEYGIGALENIATIGFSAGAMHCYGEAIAFSGNITPDSVYEDYVCDEVDQMSADVKAVCCIYAAGMAHDTKAEDVDIKEPVLLLDEADPNYPDTLPAFFFAGASGHFASGFCVKAYETLNPLTECELHMYGGVSRPFGMGTEFEGSDQMRSQLEAFLDVQFGHRSREKE